MAYGGDLTWFFWTKRIERSWLGKELGHAEVEVQLGADRDAAAADRGGICARQIGACGMPGSGDIQRSITARMRDHADGYLELLIGNCEFGDPIDNSKVTEPCTQNNQSRRHGSSGEPDLRGIRRCYRLCDKEVGTISRYRLGAYSVVRVTFSLRDTTQVCFTFIIRRALMP